MTADVAARHAATGPSQLGNPGAVRARASPLDRMGEMADVLRCLGRQLLSLAELFTEPSEPAAGQALGSDDELTPALEARLEAAVVRHRLRTKQPHPGRQARQRSARKKETGKPGHTSK